MNKNIRDLWNEAADAWNDLITTGKDYYKESVIAPGMLKLIPPMKNEDEKALDLCCGEGYYSRKLKGLGYQTCGVDISDKLISIARKKEKEVAYHCLEASRLDIFDDEYFSLLVCGMALMDAPNYKEIILEAKRVLRIGGHFVFSISHPCFCPEKGGWERDEKGRQLFFKMDNYFLEDESTVEWNMKRLKYPFKTKVYHRTLSTYFNFLAENGFTVENLAEARPDDKINDPRLEDSSRIPYCLIMKCKKTKSPKPRLTSAEICLTDSSRFPE